jgi:hypothetical protein
LAGPPEVVIEPLTQKPDGSLTLAAAEATLHGKLQYERGDGRDNIGHWTNAKDWVEWEFQVN